jgi:hypothetical protein
VVSTQVVMCAPKSYDMYRGTHPTRCQVTTCTVVRTRVDAKLRHVPQYTPELVPIFYEKYWCTYRDVHRLVMVKDLN